MNENRLRQLKLMVGQIILIHLSSGTSICGAYRGNYDDQNLEFDFENHRSNEIEKVRLTEIGSLIT
ncbi:MAG: hypothetical protein ABJO91_17935 [Ekhidna sp.]